MQHTFNRLATLDSFKAIYKKTTQSVTQIINVKQPINHEYFLKQAQLNTLRNSTGWKYMIQFSVCALWNEMPTTRCHGTDDNKAKLTQTSYCSFLHTVY